MTAKDLKTLIDTLNQNGSYLIKVDKCKYGIDYIIADKKNQLSQRTLLHAWSRHVKLVTIIKNT